MGMESPAKRWRSAELRAPFRPLLSPVVDTQMERSPLTAACREGENHKCRHRANRNGDNGRLGAELAAGEEVGAGEDGVPEPLEAVARDGASEDAAFAEIPAEVQTDGQPQISHQHVGNGE